MHLTFLYVHVYAAVWIENSSIRASNRTGRTARLASVVMWSRADARQWFRINETWRSQNPVTHEASSQPWFYWFSHCLASLVNWSPLCRRENTLIHDHFLSRGQMLIKSPAEENYFRDIKRTNSSADRRCRVTTDAPIKYLGVDWSDSYVFTWVFLRFGSPWLHEQIYRVLYGREARLLYVVTNKRKMDKTQREPRLLRVRRKILMIVL